MACPTKKEYEKALRIIDYLRDAIIREKERRENFINELCTSQEILSNYESSLKDAKEIIQKYEIYQELLNERK